VKVLVIDIGGTSVKILATGHKESRRFASGPTMTPKLMVAAYVERLISALQLDDVVLGGGQCQEFGQTAQGLPGR
jgi:polyphosphate glucokinase